MRSRFVMTLLLAACATTSISRIARADEPPVTADVESREQSRVAFRKGVAQLRAQDWAAARASFETAWSLYPHPSILLNLGIARLRTDDPVRAEQDLVRFLSEDVGASPDELAGAREALAEARTKLGTLRIVVSPPTARVAVDGKAVETVRGADPGASGVVAEVRAKPGRHVVAVEAEGYRARASRPRPRRAGRSRRHASRWRRSTPEEAAGRERTLDAGHRRLVARRPRRRGAHHRRRHGAARQDAVERVRRPDERTIPGPERPFLRHRVPHRRRRRALGRDPERQRRR